MSTLMVGLVVAATYAGALWLILTLLVAHGRREMEVAR